MASIWFQIARRDPAKVYGHVEPKKVIGLFRSVVPEVAAKYRAKLLSLTDMEAVIAMPDGSYASLYVEPYSPPSAPEPNQPHRKLAATGGLAK